jgi:hypothetical protein
VSLSRREQLAWCAGFMDGDGHFRCMGDYRFRTVVQQKYPEVLQRLQATFQAGVVRGPRSVRKKSGLVIQVYRWQTSGSKAHEAVELLWEFLSPVKQEQIAAAYDRAGYEWPAGPWEPPTWREELAWAAGFFDAEGSTHLDRHHNDRPVVAVGQRERQVMDRFQAAVGLGAVEFRRDRGKPKYTWRVGGFEKSQAVMAMLWPFLDVVKREQFLRVMSGYHAAPV